MVELMHRYLTSQREAQVLLAALYITKDKTTLQKYIDRTAPWVFSAQSDSVLEKMMQSEKLRNMKISFNPASNSFDEGFSL